MVLDADIPQLVEQQLIVALKLQDYRLFASSGRRTIVVGMDQADLVELKKQCGIKFMPHTGDVLRHKDDGELRKLQLAFAYQYNQKMYPYCQQKSNN